MPGRYLFEYAVLRVVPRVEREEFLNIGVVVYAAELRFLETRYLLNEDRLRALCPTLDIAELQRYCEAFAGICRGDKRSGGLEGLPVAARFRWLTAKRSAVLQTSPVHPGFCSDPEETLQRLLEELVLQADPAAPPFTGND